MLFTLFLTCASAFAADGDAIYQQALTRFTSFTVNHVTSIPRLLDLDQSLPPEKDVPITIPDDWKNQKTYLRVLTDLCNDYPPATDFFRPYNSNSDSLSPEDIDKMRMMLVDLQKPIQGKINPLRRQGFQEMFSEVINEERLHGINPSLGKYSQRLSWAIRGGFYRLVKKQT